MSRKTARDNDSLRIRKPEAPCSPGRQRRVALGVTHSDSSIVIAKLAPHRTHDKIAGNISAGELQKALRSDSGRIDSTNRNYRKAAIGSILVRRASSSAEQNGISAMCSVLTEEGKDEDPDEQSDDSPPFNLSALSSVVADIKRTIQNIPDESALLSVAMNYEDGSVPAKIASSIHH
jgi:hypothetical protein